MFWLFAVVVAVYVVLVMHDKSERSMKPLIQLEPDRIDTSLEIDKIWREWESQCIDLSSEIVITYQLYAKTKKEAERVIRALLVDGKGTLSSFADIHKVIPRLREVKGPLLLGEWRVEIDAIGSNWTYERLKTTTSTIQYMDDGNFMPKSSFIEKITWYVL